MGRIALRGNRYSDTTQVSNYFIDNFMDNANEAQIKIYLYLLRCIGDNIPVSVGSIADKFNYTEKDILRSLVYWDRRGLISLESDSDSNITGITIIEPSDAVAPAQLAAETSYSADRLKAFRDRSDIRQLVFISEQYLGKTLSVTDMNSLLYMHEELHFPVDLIEYLIEYCVNNKKNSMKYIEQTALCWSDEGITDVASAKEHNEKYSKDCFSVLKAFGISGRNPVRSETDFLKRWKDDYGFSMDIIIEAVDRTMKSISKPSFMYADSILKRWKDSDVKDVSDIAVLDQSHAEEKKNLYSTSSSSILPRHDRFRNFNERTYDYSDLEKDLLKKN